MKTYQMITCRLSDIAIAACQFVESPLSDVPVSEPSVIRVQAEADRDIQSSSASSSLLRVTFDDKHDEFRQLEYLKSKSHFPYSEPLCPEKIEEPADNEGRG